MKKVLLLLFFAGLSTSAFADLTIVQKVVSSPMMGQPGKNGTMTQYYKGTKSRINTDANTYMIIDVKDGKMYTVDSSKKQVMVMPREMLNKTAEMGMMMMGGGNFSVNKTGKSDTVNGFKCDEYVITGKTLNITSCATTDVDMKELEPFKAFGQNIVGKALSEVPGLSVRSDFKMNIMGQEIAGNSEVISVSKDPIPDSMFVIPADYQQKEMNLPAMTH
jgi:hypothetical protein